MTLQFQPLFQHLSDQLARSLVSRFSPANDALRLHLIERFSRVPGSRTALLSSPLFEATFGFESAPMTMADLSPELLHPSLIAALDTQSTQRFPSTRHPFAHQVAAWRSLIEDRRSTLVSSGTGSGKTECFLVPILDDLARQAAASSTTLTGVQAIFLYPLNALIASQRDRLDAWTSPFEGRIRYCLYNGLTPDQVRGQAITTHPWEVPDRRTLRDSPPPILVTNATMLEYMLVRHDDHPIIAKSRGALRWFVLDEAHTYIGSQAAELALLLRRVRATFEVPPENIRIVATSATMGDDRSHELKQFLADLAGVGPEQINLIRGRRVTPELPAENAISDRILAIRKVLTKAPATAAELSSLLNQDEGQSPASDEDVIRAIDAAHPMTEPVPILPVRAHAFVRALAGLWACINRDCSGRDGLHAPSADVTDWHFGKLFDVRRLHCDACESMVLPLVRCTSCGAEYMLGEREVTDRGRTLKPPAPARQGDLGRIDSDSDEDDSDETNDDYSLASPTDSRPDMRCLIGRWTKPEELPILVHRVSGEDQPAEPFKRTDLVKVTLVPRQRDGSGGAVLACGRCGRTEHPTRFLPFASSRPHMLETALPLALERMPPPDASIPGKRDRRPLLGRRVLTFTDSRQGSARFALLLGLAGERRFAESWLFHHVWQSSRAKSDAADLTNLNAEIAGLESAISSGSPESSRFLRGMLDGKLKERAAALTPPPPSVPFRDAVNALANEDEVMRLHRIWQAEGRPFAHATDVAAFLLHRMWLQRPRRRLSPETTGILSLEFTGITDAPMGPSWRDIGASPEDWHNALALALDRLRTMNAAELPIERARWLGFTWTPVSVVGPDDDEAPPRMRRFFSKGPQGLRTGFGTLIARRFGLDRDNSAQHARLVSLLDDLWVALERRLIRRDNGGRVLNLETTASIAAPTRVWRCPVTLRALPRTLGGFTPYAIPTMSDESSTATPYATPRFPPHLAFAPNAMERDAIEHWLKTDPDVAVLRSAGLWTDICDTIANRSGYFRAAEHSAQIHRKDLERLEADFKTGEVNILSCSTTMEMGIDIGGMNMVAMNNVPPAPANYLQRAGRAGRRQETASLSLTVCRPQPHDEGIFRRPGWPFRTPIAVPAVALNSRPIVQRHLHAFALARFLIYHAETTRTAIQLRAGEFLNREMGVTLAETLCDWLRGPAAGDESFTQHVRTLLANTVLAPLHLSTLLAEAADALSALHADWMGELMAIRAELNDIAGDDKAARSGADIRAERMTAEFLLKELAARGWLPSYGFPHGVVPLVTTNIVEMTQSRDKDRGRIDDQSTWREFPTRSLDIALREYAPGSSIVLGGRVYTSAGVTLNWHKPPQKDGESREIQSVRWAFRCKGCGFVGDAPVQPTNCPECQSDKLNRSRYLRPAGFSVDFLEAPHNNMDQQTFSRTRDPWVSAGNALWEQQGSLIRFRRSPDGRVFHSNLSIGEAGFDICFRCGRAVPSPKRKSGESATSPLDGHRPLRYRRRDRNQHDQSCHGTSETFAIQQNLALGSAQVTDVFELQLKHPVRGATHAAQFGSVSETQAISIAVALKQALAGILGIDRRELGFHVSTLFWDNMKLPVVALFDTAPGGAGYASQAARDIPALLRAAHAILECPQDCDAACHGCLVSFETDDVADRLNRHEALELVDLLVAHGY